MPRQSPAPEIRARIRDDFIRRLFAVAISVGFAATLVKMNWITNATWPNTEEWNQIYILIVALIATVLSWDGYLVAIEERPLFGFFRFLIDVVLVFIYMILLITSYHAHFWLPILVLIFVLYTIWDHLTIWEHLRTYNSTLTASKIAKLSFGKKFKQVMNVYVGGISDRSDTRRGPVITLFWTVYFVLFYLLGIQTRSIPAACFFAAAGLIIYREDKRRHGFKMLTRILLGALLLVAARLTLCVI